MIARIHGVIGRCLFKMFIWTGGKFFNRVTIYSPQDNRGCRVRAIHFSVSDRDMNSSMREYVENLDKANDNNRTRD